MIERWSSPTRKLLLALIKLAAWHVVSRGLVSLASGIHENICDIVFGSLTTSSELAIIKI